MSQLNDFSIAFDSSVFNFPEPLQFESKKHFIIYEVTTMDSSEALKSFPPLYKVHLVTFPLHFIKPTWQTVKSYLENPPQVLDNIWKFQV